MLPLHAPVLEPKQEVESALRDTYSMLERFIILIEIKHLEDLGDKDLLGKFVESGEEISMKGYGMDINSQLRHERGLDNWKVKCEWGACDDDGREWWNATFVRRGNTHAAMALMIPIQYRNCLSVLEAVILYCQEKLKLSINLRVLLFC